MQTNLFALPMADMRHGEGQYLSWWFISGLKGLVTDLAGSCDPRSPRGCAEFHILCTDRQTSVGTLRYNACARPGKAHFMPAESGFRPAGHRKYDLDFDPLKRGEGHRLFLTRV